MKLHQIAALSSGFFFAVLLAGLAPQHRRLESLQHDLAVHESSLGVPSGPEPVPAPVPPEAPLTDAELRELLSLRREAGRLRSEKAKLVALVAENARLKSALSNAVVGVNRVPVPEGYLVASQAKFVGFATPADTLQSFLWSLRNRDTNALFQTLTSESVDALAENLARQGTDSFFGEARMPGFLIKSVEEIADNTVTAALQFDPENSQANMKFTLERDPQGRWRLRLE